MFWEDPVLVVSGAELVLAPYWLLLAARTAEKPVQPLTSGQLRSSLVIPDTAWSSGLKSCEPGNNLQRDADSLCAHRVLSPVWRWGPVAIWLPLSSLHPCCSLPAFCQIYPREGLEGWPKLRKCTPCTTPALHVPVKAIYLCPLAWAEPGVSW